NRLSLLVSLFLSHATPPPDIYTLSLHDALPIFIGGVRRGVAVDLDEREVGLLGAGEPAPEVGEELLDRAVVRVAQDAGRLGELRSEEHTSELQSHLNLVCRLLLEKKK